MPKAVRARVNWSRKEASAVYDLLAHRPLFAGRVQTLDDLHDALATKPRRKIPGLYFELERAEAVLDVLAEDQNTIVGTAAAKLARAVRDAMFRGHPSPTNPAASARMRRVRRSDAGRFL